MPVSSPSDKGSKEPVQSGLDGCPLHWPRCASLSRGGRYGCPGARSGLEVAGKRRGARSKMPQAELETSRIDRQQEDARLAALAATEILDTAPEPGFDAITRLAPSTSRPTRCCWALRTQSRVWIKSFWGETVRELPRKRLDLRDGACGGWAGGGSGYLEASALRRQALTAAAA